MASLLEQLRDGGITVKLPDGYSMEFKPSSVTVNGCDCSVVPTDKQVRQIYEAMGAYLRHVKSRKD